MKAGRILSVVVVCVLLATVSVSAGATPLAEPCTPGNNTDPACRSEQGNQGSFARWLPLIIRFVDANHNHLGQTWTGSNNPLKIQGSFGAPDYAPLVLSNSASDGMIVGSTGSDGDGVHVQSAGDDGVEVISAGGDGVSVGSTGSDGDGVHVQSAGDDGVEVVSAGGDGVYVGSAGSIFTPANGVWAHTSSFDGYWGLYTPDRIFAGTTVAASALTLIARAGGDLALTPGDVVAAAGVSDPLPGSTIPLALVRPADASFAGIVGVVERRMALTPKPQHQGDEAQEPVFELRSADGPAQPGDYVAITVLGVAQVKVGDTASIEAGQRLTVAKTSGYARALRTVEVEGVKVDESGPTLGVALESAKDGMVWVLVNPQ